MHVIMVRIKVKPDCIAPFEQQMRLHVESTRRTEPGCLQFDVSVDMEDPTVYYIYEVYRDDQAMAAHMKSPTLKANGEKMPGWIVERSRHDAVPWAV
jgi:(4S)-4-hydroxy-5-phosphonooxypentane-2,3-dione isomerase